MITSSSRSAAAAAGPCRSSQARRDRRTGPHGTEVLAVTSAASPCPAEPVEGLLRPAHARVHHQQDAAGAQQARRARADPVDDPAPVEAGVPGALGPVGRQPGARGGDVRRVGDDQVEAAPRGARLEVSVQDAQGQRRRRAFRRAVATAAQETSTAVTRAPLPAMRRASAPVPVPISSASVRGPRLSSASARARKRVSARGPWTPGSAIRPAGRTAEVRAVVDIVGLRIEGRPGSGGPRWLVRLCDCPVEGSASAIARIFEGSNEGGEHAPVRSAPIPLPPSAAVATAPSRTADWILGTSCRCRGDRAPIRGVRRPRPVRWLRLRRRGCRSGRCRRPCRTGSWPGGGPVVRPGPRPRWPPCARDGRATPGPRSRAVRPARP